MKRFKALLLLALAGMTLSACAHRYREATTGRSAEEVAAFLDSLGSASSGGSTDLTRVRDMVFNYPEAVIYFSEAPGPLGPIHAVTPVNFKYLTNTNLGIGDLDSIRVYFIDLDNGGNSHDNALVIDYVKKGETAVHVEVFTNFDIEPGSIEDGEFMAVLRSQNGREIVARSFDVEDEELNQTIQIELSALENGEEVENLGQISSMEGF